ncbi:MAG: hypothetical protein PHW34_09030 [Hespellia sp.]|nr:hypothetical protein [Hespellia sp.]
MILKDVLHILDDYIKPFGYKHNDLYKKLFEKAELKEDLNINQTVKNTFSSRALSGKLLKYLCSESGFLDFCALIEKEYLSIVSSYKEIYQDLYILITQDEYLPDDDKQALLASCNPSQATQLARFIAVSILCANYNFSLEKKKSSTVNNSYGLNVKAFVCLGKEYPQEYKLWKAAQAAFLQSHRKGQRFYSLNIIQQLLPRGYISESQFQAKGKLDNGSSDTVMSLCQNTTDNIAIIGDGGIGKTTFFQQLLSVEYLTDTKEPRSYKTGRPVPFFIELNRCPEHICDWYDDSLKKTNFITRYIAQIQENHSSLDSVSAETLINIEKEFQRIPSDGTPHYLLLLDGFNEVKAGQSIRSYLSNEISMLSNYPNIRVITASRETQAAYFASSFQNIHLIGLEIADIINYLRSCQKSDSQIGLIMSCKPLVQCLRIPLYLCMFSAEDASQKYLPSTPGEILYCFFHRNSAFYNIRRRAHDAGANPLNEDQTAFVLDFILPYIGWCLEADDAFSMNEDALRNTIQNSLQCIASLFGCANANPFPDFSYNGHRLMQTLHSLMLNDGQPAFTEIIDCIHGYLGIVYRYQLTEGDFTDRNRFAFGHHQFRDYFSSIWDFQLLSMLQCITPSLFCKQEEDVSFSAFLNQHYWQHHKTEFISQIFMEHRNRPTLSPDSHNWYIPTPDYDEQKVLGTALSFCRELCEQHIDIHYLLQNILSAILEGRKELSGLDLHNLDLKHCNFFNITCSRSGKSRTLSANFDGCTLYEETFKSESHQDDVMEHVYSDRFCFTIDDTGVIKCWDVLSGKLEYSLQTESPSNMLDYSSFGFLQVSPDGKWLAAKMQESTPMGMHIGIQLFSLDAPESAPKILLPPNPHKSLTSFSFTGDSNALLMLCDFHDMYCFSILNTAITYQYHYQELFKHSQLYADSATSAVYVFTAEYNEYEFEDTLLDDWQDDSDDSIENDSYDTAFFSEELNEEEQHDSTSVEDDTKELHIPCMLCILFPEDGRCKTLYSFTGAPKTRPTAKYVPYGSYFLLFNNQTGQIEQYNCSTNTAVSMFEHLTLENCAPPDAIHLHMGHPGECYIMYRNNCYLVDAESRIGDGILMKYSSSGISKLLAVTDQDSELYFKVTAAPANNRFLVRNEMSIYEWDSENDFLLPKYNSAYYGCTALFTDRESDQNILVHQYNGVSVFSGTPPKLQNYYCFEEPDYYISNCLYKESIKSLALTFSRQDHEKVMLLQLTDGMETTCFSTLKKNESVETLCFDDSGNHLLITTQYQCVEYDLVMQTAPCVIAKAETNERIAGGNYNGGIIEVAIVEDSFTKEESCNTRCDCYKKRRRKERLYFERIGYYVIPVLDDSLFPFFIYQHGDLGVEGAHKENGIQTYWVTRGFFLPLTEALASIPPLQYFKIQGNRQIKQDRQITPLKMIYFRHTAALESPQRDKKSGFSFTYLSDDMTQAVFLKDSKILSFQTNLNHCSYEDIESGFRMLLGNYDGHAYWDYAVPLNQNTLLCCFESYRLITINIEDGCSGDEIEYAPGVAICGCSFHDIKADEDVLDTIRTNGHTGLLKEKKVLSNHID